MKGLVRTWNQMVILKVRSSEQEVSGPSSTVLSSYLTRCYTSLIGSSGWTGGPIRCGAVISVSGATDMTGAIGVA
jgi:hypothetical protein